MAFVIKDGSEEPLVFQSEEELKNWANNNGFWYKNGTVIVPLPDNGPVRRYKVSEERVPTFSVVDNNTYQGGLLKGITVTKSTRSPMSRAERETLLETGSITPVKLDNNNVSTAEFLPYLVRSVKPGDPRAVAATALSAMLTYGAAKYGPEIADGIRSGVEYVGKLANDAYGAILESRKKKKKSKPAANPTTEDGIDDNEDLTPTPPASTEATTEATTETAPTSPAVVPAANPTPPGGDDEDSEELQNQLQNQLLQLSQLDLQSLTLLPTNSTSGLNTPRPFKTKVKDFYKNHPKTAWGLTGLAALETVGKTRKYLVHPGISYLGGGIYTVISDKDFKPLYPNTWSSGETWFGNDSIQTLLKIKLPDGREVYVIPGDSLKQSTDSVKATEKELTESKGSANTHTSGSSVVKSLYKSKNPNTDKSSKDKTK